VSCAVGWSLTSLFSTNTAMLEMKMAEPIEMKFGMSSQMEPWNHVLDRVQMPLRERALLGAVWLIEKHCKI